MKNRDILIVGYGVVGKNLEKELESLHPDIYDIKFVNEEFEDRRKQHYDFVFICVDTPFDDKNLCDLTQVKKAIRENNADIYVIKSTILPGTTLALEVEFGKNFVFSPEYYGDTQHCNNFEFNFTILGGHRQECMMVQQLLQEVYDARHTFHIVDSTTAELVKYMENAWLATKVTFCQEFFEIASKCCVDYEKLRELFILDPRVNPSHTFVYRDRPYWDSHCLNKDVPAIALKYDSRFLKEMIRANASRKFNHAIPVEYSAYDCPFYLEDAMVADALKYRWENTTTRVPSPSISVLNNVDDKIIKVETKNKRSTKKLK